MIEIDGSRFSGSGTLVRYSVALATLKRTPLHITNIRKKRPKPGLRAQHLKAVQACCVLSNGTTEGAETGSQELVYYPGAGTEGGNFRFDIGTAGSAAMAAFTLIPVCLFAQNPSKIHITGGLFQDFAPSVFHMSKVLAGLLGLMGARLSIEMVRPGYVPRGQGELKLLVEPMNTPPAPLLLTEQGRITSVKGISIASHLSDRNVGLRMADAAESVLKKEGFQADILKIDDSSAVQKGAGLCLWVQMENGAIIGSDQAGKQGRSAEAIGKYVARSLLEDLRSGATTDRYAADQMIIFAALANGTTEYVIPWVTDHVRSNLWLVETILGARQRINGNTLTIRGIGYHN